MNGKFLLFFMVICNVVALVLMSQVPASAPDYVQSRSSNLALQFYDMNFAENTSQQIAATSSFTNATDAMGNANTGSQSSASAFTGLIDTFRMVLAFFTLLTPIPFLAYLIVLNTPLTILVLFGVPMSILYIISVMEFARGGQL